MNANPIRLLLLTLLAVQVAHADDVEFTRDIRPILSNTCFTCHGPDESKRESDLRLDTKAGAFAENDGRRAITPGDPDKSEILLRVTSEDSDLRMPPPEASRQLTTEQIALLRKWIEQGAKWREHWAFVRPHATRPAKSMDPERVNEIDDFVAAELNRRHNRSLAKRARKTTLIRRVTLDLTGLPPTLAEIDAFLEDDSPEAYEKVVDRLLRSPRFGERMAMPWLDAARYADTSGYQNDGPRNMWRWRDWVIDAYNNNMPFDRFTVEQLAGDLLDARRIGQPAVDYESAWRGDLVTEPERLNQLIASAFNRNHRGNAEGGIIPEEYQVEYVVDRVDTTATVWLGLTLGCARCHDHKYDPLKQRDFYQLFAFFNNVPEFGRAVKEGNSPPYIKAPTPEQLPKLKTLSRQLEQAEASFERLKKDRFAAQRKWEKKLVEMETDKPLDWTISDGLVAAFPLDGDLAGSERSASWVGPPGRFVDGKTGKAIRLDGRTHVEAGDFANFGYFDKFSFSAWVRPDSSSGVILSRMTPVAQGDGYNVRLENGRVQVNLVKRWLDDSLRVQTRRQVAADRWTHITVAYDGSREPTGIRVYLDGRESPLDVQQDFINQTFAAASQPVRIGGGDANFTGALDDVRIYSRALSSEEAEILAADETISRIAAKPRDQRSRGERRKLSVYFLRHQSPPAIRDAYQRLVKARTAHLELLESLPTLMVMQEMKTPRSTHILKRGEYDKPGDSVEADVPELLPPLPPDAPANRLGLAKWLVDASNPLTARVTVNRAWQLHFGEGLVRTAEDFGVQGEAPSHPKLLDWLALAFVESGWDVKWLHKTIVMSGVYRQTSSASKELLEQDPDNRWLARGPRRRLPAETVRDQALALSGLLTDRIGGPSVFPYQPEGLWKEIATDTNYPQSHGDDLYRRSLYTYWKRTVAPPTMATLDAPSRESCIVRRSRTNTPLQALALMNEVSFVEAARNFAARAMRKQESEQARLEFLFRAATARRPKASEMKVLKRSLEAHLGEFAAAPEAAKKLIAMGESPVADDLDPQRLAAYTLVASMILNLDEVISKE